MNNVLKPYEPCGAHPHLIGPDQACSNLPCECTGDGTNPTAFTAVGVPGARAGRVQLRALRVGRPCCN